MPRPASYIPHYRLHKPTGKAVVTIDGKDRYLGRFNSAESRREHDRLITEWIAAGRGHLDRSPGEITVSEVLLAYLKYADQRYRDAAGNQTREIETMALAFRPLKNAYGNTRAAQFKPLSLIAVRAKMIEAKLCRRVINQRVGDIRRMFKWASANRLIDATVHHGLLAVENLQRGQNGVRESEPVEPVSLADVNAVLPYLAPTLQRMVEIQRLTGMRSGELCQMRPIDIDMSGPTWVFNPATHKTQRCGHTRKVHLGPACQQQLKPFLTCRIDEYIFIPRRATAERNEIKRQARKTRLQPSQVCRAKLHPERPPGEPYNSRSYHQALRQPCEGQSKRAC